MSLNPEASADTPLIQQAKALLQQRQPAEAAQAVRRHLAMAPGVATDYMLLGVCLAEAGEGLQAIAAMEQAATMDPNSASIAYNLGLLYRKAGRSSNAVAALERAVALRPGYDAPQRALDELRAQSQQATQAFAGPAGSVVQCPHCGMATRAAPSCEFCSKPLQPVVVTADAATVATIMAQAQQSEFSGLEEGPLFSRLMRACWMLISSPLRAVNSGLDYFFNSPGAPLAVLLLYLVALVAQISVALIAVHSAGGDAETTPGGAVIQAVAAGLIWTFATAFVIACYNAVTGGADSFLGDFGSLVLSFMLIFSTVQLSLFPMTAVLALTGSLNLFFIWLVQNLWTWLLQVMLVMAAADINWLAAAAILFGISFFGNMFIIGATVKMKTGR